MTRSVFQVYGAEEVAGRFARLGFQASDLRGAFKTIGDEIVKDARSEAPKRSGRLAGNIRAGLGKTRATVSAGSGSLLYAGVQEYGWRGHGIEPQPYLRPAADENAERAARILVAEMNRLIRSAGLG